MSSSKLAAGFMSLLKVVSSKLAAGAAGLIVLLKLIIVSSSGLPSAIRPGLKIESEEEEEGQYDFIRLPSAIRPGLKIESEEEEEGQYDFISQLPDDILTSILFFLPLKDCARTSVLSSRWRNVWKHSPLHLNDSQSTFSSSSSSSSRWPMDDLFSLDPWKWNTSKLRLTRYQMSSLMKSLSADPNPLDQPYNSRFYLILSSHCGPVHSLRLSGVKGLAFRGTVTRLITRVIHRNIRELTLDFNSPYCEYRYELPFSLYGCGSLQSLTLTKCHFPKPAAPSRSSVLPNLKELHLMMCSGLGIDLFEAVLMSCMSLEIMQLVSCEAGCPGLGRVAVSSASLRKFVLSDAGGPEFLDIKELIVEDAPNLECLMLSSDVTKSCDVKVRHATKLQVLGFISAKFKKLQLGGNYLVPQSSESTQTVNLKVTPSAATLSTVKTLAIDIGSSRDYGGMIAGLLGCFPCIENLYISGRHNRYEVDLQNDHHNRYEVDTTLKLQNDHHLKRVVVYGFHGDEVLDVELVRFLVATGKVLDEIIILENKYLMRQERVRIERGLGFGRRASKHLKLNFSKEDDCTSHVSLWEPLMDHKFA